MAFIGYYIDQDDMGGYICMSVGVFGAAASAIGSAALVCLYKLWKGCGCKNPVKKPDSSGNSSIRTNVRRMLNFEELFRFLLLKICVLCLVNFSFFSLKNDDSNRK